MLSSSLSLWRSLISHKGSNQFLLIVLRKMKHEYAHILHLVTPSCHLCCFLAHRLKTELFCTWKEKCFTDSGCDWPLLGGLALLFHWKVMQSDYLIARYAYLIGH